MVRKCFKNTTIINKPLSFNKVVVRTILMNTSHTFIQKFQPHLYKCIYRKISWLQTLPFQKFSAWNIYLKWIVLLCYQCSDIVEKSNLNNWNKLYGNIIILKIALLAKNILSKMLYIYIIFRFVDVICICNK